MWRSEDHLGESVLCFYHVIPGDWTWVTGWAARVFVHGASSAALSLNLLFKKGHNDNKKPFPIQEMCFIPWSSLHFLHPNDALHL